MPADEVCAQLETSSGIARLTLSRPHRRNAVNAQMHRELRDALDVIEGDPSIMVLILTGAGTTFCSGQDLSERASMLAEGDIDLQESVTPDYNSLIMRLCSLSIPVISAVRGIAYGAGASIALAADIVIAAKSSALQFGFSRIGLGMDSGVSWLLPRLIGLPRARGLALLAQPVDAVTAERWGLIWRAVEDDALEQEVASVTQQLASASKNALSAIKRQFRDALSVSFESALAGEATVQGRLGRSSDYREGVAAFLEKRAPKFS